METLKSAEIFVYLKEAFFFFSKQKDEYTDTDDLWLAVLSWEAIWEEMRNYWWE